MWDGLTSVQANIFDIDMIQMEGASQFDEEILRDDIQRREIALAVDFDGFFENGA